MDAQGKEIEAGEGRLHVAEGAAHTHVSSWGYACFLTVNATSKQCRAMQEAFGLSTRETEVMELIARGNSMASIAERLVISENTVRTHAKHIYTKLDIHRRQELLDMLHE